LQIEFGCADFLCDLIRFMRFVANIRGPQELFHLKPDVRVPTTNGHHVTWTNEGLLKEFHSIEEEQMNRIQQVYSLRLANVEWGTVKDGRSVMVTRVGFRLQDALTKRLCGRDAILADVESCVNQLHGLGSAHCDISIQNVFVDERPPHAAFLVDLEYLTPLRARAPDVRNAPNPPPTDAESLDKYQLQIFKNELMTI